MASSVECEMPGAALRDIAQWCHLVRAEYLEMPGLCLTHPQIQRLWNLGPSECDAVLSHLVSKGFLRLANRGEYVLAEGALARVRRDGRTRMSRSSMGLFSPR